MIDQKTEKENNAGTTPKYPGFFWTRDDSGLIVIRFWSGNAWQHAGSEFVLITPISKILDWGHLPFASYPDGSIAEQETNEANWVKAFNTIAAGIEHWANRKGWNSDDPVGQFFNKEGQFTSALVNYDIAKLGLMVTEISEAIEARRHNDPPSDKISEFTGQEEELADCIVRIMHHAAHRKLRVAEALVAKLAYNEKRPYKHGKQA